MAGYRRRGGAYGNIRRTGKYKSKFEETTAQQIAAAGHDVRYEENIIRYVRPERKSSYKPDFSFDGFYIEAKGRFLVDDRTKHLLLKEQRPDVEVRFVFTNAHAKITGTKTTYAQWCDKHGFKWAHKTVPADWLNKE